MQFLKAMWDTLTAEHRKHIDGAEMIPNVDDQDQIIASVMTSINAHIALFLGPNGAKPNLEEGAMQSARCEALKALMLQKEEKKARKDRMTAAADLGLQWMRTNGGTVIGELLDRFAGEPDRMMQLRSVIQEIRDTFGGIPQQDRAEIDDDLEAIAPARNKEELLRNLVALQRLRLEQTHYAATFPAAVQAGQLVPVMTDPQAVFFFRRRISGMKEAEELRSIREWMDEPQAGRTMAAVKERVIWFCQQNVMAVGEGGGRGGSVGVKRSREEQGGGGGDQVHHAASAASVAMAMAAGAAGADQFLHAHAAQRMGPSGVVGGARGYQGGGGGWMERHQNIFNYGYVGIG